MRVALGGIAMEGCPFNPLPTRLADFQVLRGEALRTRYAHLVDDADVAWTPLLWASAVPGGSVEPSAYAQLKTELLAGLEAGGPWDGVYLDLHGSLHVAGMDDAEGDLTSAVRTVVGPDCLIAASYDLHGNLSERVMAQLDLLTAYRTAPHTDTEETRARACRLLVTCLHQGVHPYKAFVRVPLLLPGEYATTDVEPGRSLYAHLPQLIQDGILDASLLMGFPWADEPRAGASVVAFGTEPEVTHRAAVSLAQALWDARQEFSLAVFAGSVDACIEAALAAPEPTIFIGDSSDNITGGAVGDVPYVLARLLALGVARALVAPLVDAEGVAACWVAGEGAAVQLAVGSKLDPRPGPPLPVAGRVLRLAMTKAGERQAVLQVAGVTVVLSERRTPFTTVDQFTQLGLDPLAHKIVVVKLGYLFPELAHIAPRAMLAIGPGAISLDLTTLPFQRLTRPIYPLDPQMQWTAPDQAQD